MTATIPTIDLGAPGAGRALIGAYESVGFAQVIGHGVDPDLVRGVFEANRVFHELTLVDKLTVEADENHRGYIALATATDRASELGTAHEPNQSESFIVMNETNPGTYLAGRNRWPDLLGFRAMVEAYAAAMYRLAHHVIAIFAEELGAGDVFAQAFASPTTWLRLLHYPAASRGHASRVGSAPHVDFGAITVLAQDDVGGLQVRTADNRWVDVAPDLSAFVVNTGEMMRRWSNNNLVATPHRVVNRTDQERYSVAYFFDPHMQTIVSPLASCGRSDPDLEPVRFDDYVRHQLEATYDQHRGTD